MMKLLPALLFLTITHTLFGQNATDTIAGEYHLQGVMETASAILLKPDHTFEIFFSYGAMDRQGSGKWALDQGQAHSQQSHQAGDRLFAGQQQNGSGQFHNH
jgi:hypothetical protein